MDSKTEQTVIETKEHIANVSKFIYIIINELADRALNHDASKLKEPELSIFTEYTDKLKGSTYGSDEYLLFLKKMYVALEHHYAKNRHHPDHFADGLDGMNIVDLIEMFCDWKAATLRHADGDILKSIKEGRERFDLDPQLAQIFTNSIELFEGKS